MTKILKKTASQKKGKLIRRISRGHQITLPPYFLKKNNLHTGDSVEIIEQEGQVIIQPLTFISAKDKQKLIAKIHTLFAEMDKQTSALPKDEESLMNIIDQEKTEARRPS